MLSKLICEILISILFISATSICKGDEARDCEISSFWTRISERDCIQDEGNNALTCANQNFTCIPYWPLKIGNTLILSRNRIRILLNGVFKRQFTQKWDLERLLELDLSKNEINTIQPLAFIGLNSLKILNLNYNNLSQIPSPSFAPLFELTYLHLSGNPIKNIQLTDFENTPKLRELNLVSCEISTLSHSPFRNLPNLNILRLKSNLLTELGSDVFEGLINLLGLDLRNNNLMTIELIEWRTTPFNNSLLDLTYVLMDGNSTIKFIPKS